ncbi:MAG: dihydroneopterin aldolase [Pseudonocardiales bacterium]
MSCVLAHPLDPVAPDERPPTCDLIEVDELRLRCVLGVNREERRDRQDVVISLRIGADARSAEVIDCVEVVWNYRTATKAIIDHVELFGLDTPPDPCHEITELSSDAVLRATVRSVVGRDLLLDTAAGPLLADTRLLAGWLLYPTTAASTGLQLRACDYARSDNAANQASLF